MALTKEQLRERLGWGFFYVAADMWAASMPWLSACAG